MRRKPQPSRSNCYNTGTHSHTTTLRIPALTVYPTIIEKAHLQVLIFNVSF